MLHDGCIAEMKTGEGKTLVSTLAAYLNALTGNGVHGMTLCSSVLCHPDVACGHELFTKYHEIFYHEAVSC